MPVTVFCLLGGKVVQLEISPATHALVRKAMAKFDVLYVQNILVAAFKKYGVRESSILKYIEKDLKK